MARMRTLLQRGVTATVAVAVMLLSPSLHLHPEDGLVGHDDHAGVLHSTESHPQAPLHVEASDLETDADCASCAHRSQRLVASGAELRLALAIASPLRVGRGVPPTPVAFTGLAAPRGPPSTPSV